MDRACRRGHGLHGTTWHQNRDPNAFFSTSLYLSANPDVAAAGINPLAHYAFTGWQEGRVPSIAFDTAAYFAENPDVAAQHVDPLFHFLAAAPAKGASRSGESLLAPNGFDFAYYLRENPDVAAAHVDPLAHFQTTGWHEGRNPNAYFDTAGYLSAYTDVAEAGFNPFDHYNTWGWHEGPRSLARLRHHLLSRRQSGCQGCDDQSAAALSSRSACTRGAPPRPTACGADTGARSRMDISPSQHYARNDKGNDPRPTRAGRSGN